MTGMGRVVPPGDADALAQAILAVLYRPEDYRGDPQAVALRFSPDAIAAEYEELFEEVKGGGDG
jgi:glycosyltransferase involved in cell wall biosynthesis